MVQTVDLACTQERENQKNSYCLVGAKLKLGCVLVMKSVIPVMLLILRTARMDLALGPSLARRTLSVSRGLSASRLTSGVVTCKVYCPRFFSALKLTTNTNHPIS